MCKNINQSISVVELFNFKLNVHIDVLFRSESVWISDFSVTFITDVIISEYLLFFSNKTLIFRSYDILQIQSVENYNF